MKNRAIFLQSQCVLPLILSAMLTACSNVMATPPETTEIQTPNGVVIGDVTAHSAVIWSRADREAQMRVRIHGGLGASLLPEHYQVDVIASNDYSGQIALHNLKPDTEYRYSVTFTEDTWPAFKSASKALNGHFRTAPQAERVRTVKFAWGGDLAGQNVCRDVDKGFAIFDVLNQGQWDFFIGLGDMIYADGVCEATGGFGNHQIPGAFGPAADLKNYWAHWSYNRADPGFQRFLSQTPYVAIWDDHEVVNDFGPLHDTRDSAPYVPGEHLLPLGLEAFLDYNPIAMTAETPKRLYRHFRWGQHLEVFVLDTRQYRDANFLDDDADAPKSMLGREQLTWLKEKLLASDATWKMIVSSVPMSIPTGFPPENGRDGWANFDQDTGFEYELTDILRFMQRHGIDNSVWLTTDVHFSEGFVYRPFNDAPQFEVYEFVSGPLNAGLFPNENFDESLQPQRLFFHGAPAGLDYQGALEYLTFGAVEINEEGHLTVRIINAKGNVVTEQHLKPQ